MKREKRKIRMGTFKDILLEIANVKFETLVERAAKARGKVLKIKALCSTKILILFCAPLRFLRCVIWENKIVQYHQQKWINLNWSWIFMALTWTLFNSLHHHQHFSPRVYVEGKWDSVNWEKNSINGVQLRPNQN